MLVVKNITGRTFGTRFVGVKNLHDRGPKVQYRSFLNIPTTYWKDVWRTKSLSPTNPLMTILGTNESTDHIIETASNDTIPTTTIPTTPKTPVRFHWNDIQSYHIPEVLTCIQQLQQNLLVQQQKQQEPTKPTFDIFLQQMDTVQGKFDTLKHIISYIEITTNHNHHNNNNNCTTTASFENTVQYHDGWTLEQQEIIYKLFQKHLLQQQQQQPQTYWMQQWIRDYEHRTGISIHTTNDEKEEYQMLTHALQDICTRFLQESTTTTTIRTKQFIGDMYNYLGIQQRRAQLLGYKHIVEQVLETNGRMVKDLIQIHNLHEQIKTTVVPLLINKNESSSTSTSQYWNEYLSSTASFHKQSTTTLKESKSSELQNDQMKMLRFQNHITFDGTIEFMKQLSLELFGFKLVEDNEYDGNQKQQQKQSTGTWDQDIRYFHVFDMIHPNQIQVGSFYMDPYNRNGKIQRPFTSPVIHRSINQLPVVAFSMTLEPPAWDTDTTPMTWDDVETFFHEMGHVFQLLSAQTTMGTLLGAQHLSLDLSELLPKFMEHWLMEPSTILTLMALSKPSHTTSEFDNETEMTQAIEAALRVRSHQKAWQLAQLSFLGELELSLFSSKFDIRGNESMLNFQNRLAGQYTPHDLPHPQDITPLLQIFRENANGRMVAWYRYLWCDVLSASLFQKCKSIYASSHGAKDGTTDTTMDLRGLLRRCILDPGAMIDSDKLLREFEISEISPDDLFDLYKLK